ncbi:MAG: NAD+ synthase [Candidatus Omnitrophica bacterium]|nr:NAD+ synthase [Candidatus Omnitrophota bacterium]
MKARKNSVRLAIAQINPTVGDMGSNCKKIAEFILKAQGLGADIISFPELAITGYPPEDLLLKANFVDDNMAVLKKMAKAVNDIVVVVGFVDRIKSDIYNAAAVIYKGEVKGVYHKIFLPNYGVFDEKRYFKAGSSARVFRLDESVFGVNICEDIWHRSGPVAEQAKKGASLIINISSSPYCAGRIKEREETIRAQARTNGVYISYTNLVGGQDELVFDGQSMVVDGAGKIIARAEAFREDILIADLDVPAGRSKPVKDAVTIAKELPKKNKPHLPRREVRVLDPVPEIYEALLVGLKDYVTKNDFQRAVVGLSGGVDSALVATLAADALGKNNTIGVFMPTRYSSEQSEIDAKAVAANLGIKFITISIEQIFKLFLMSLEPKFEGHGRDTAEENLQARIRGNTLMALSNKFGWMVLTTGNKSEMSTGYATLYGDMAGGFAVIKDVYKTMVYKLAKYRNSINKVIPDSIIEKEPTAELKPNQRDIDTLPPYDILDDILKLYVEKDKGLSEIIGAGFDKDTVIKVLEMVDKSEYKRRQSPPGIKITPKAFGKDRRMPITNKYK